MLDEKKKFNIDKQGDTLKISYKWFSPVAFFLVFFCIVWDGFLVVWFAVDTPISFKMFAIMHVAVGVGLTYYTVCLFVNSSFISVDKQKLSIRFAPLPWVGNKTLEARDIEQMFVQEKVSHGKNGVSRSYHLNALMKNGGKVKLIGSAAMNSVEDTKFLEHKIESFLGIRDRQIAGEYLGNSKPTIDQIPRKKETEYNPTRLTLKNLLKGYIITYNLTSWEVIYEAQYDWANGESDKLYRFSGENNSNIILYVRDEMGLTIPYLENRLQTDATTQAFAKLNVQNAPLELTFEKVHFRKQNYSEGKMFVSGSRSYTELVQWFYINENGNKSLRIIQFKHGEVTLFLGKKSKEIEYSNILPSENSRGI